MKIGNSNPPMYVDRHGDNLARVETEGGYFRLAHDAWLSTVFADCAYHGLRVSREVQGLFRACIPLPAERVAFDRRPWATRRGLVPDATLAAGVGPDRLVECKFLHWGVSTYTKADLEHERIRINQRLLQWLCVMQPDAALAKAQRALSAYFSALLR